MQIAMSFLFFAVKSLLIAFYYFLAQMVTRSHIRKAWYKFNKN